MQNVNNPYLQQVWSVLPRLLAGYNADQASATYGQGDRYRWAWKLIDFGNGTFQGAANGLARLLVAGLLPSYLSPESVIRRIDAMFHGADTLRRRDGSMEEALPYEASFCVTALVAYDLLTAVELLQEKWISHEQRITWLAIVRPMIIFLHRADETHGFISNHLATAAVAIYKWHALTGEGDDARGWLFLKRILDQQSDEGWFREYEGADPGYQSLCTYYLADLLRLRPDLPLAGPLATSIQFLWYCAHPDGSFGGHYGSRNTRFYVPSGAEFMAQHCPEAAAIAGFMRDSISSYKVVSLDVMDPPNLIPIFNAYCWAASLYDEQNHIDDQSLPEVPCCDPVSWQRHFPEAGLYFVRGKSHYTIISTHKGGVVYHYSVDGTLLDTGVVFSNSTGKKFSSQAYQPENLFQITEQTVAITSRLTEMHQQIPTPFQFVILRLLTMTIMRHPTISRLIKKMLVRLLITGGEALQARNCRLITLGEHCTIDDRLEPTEDSLQKCPVTAPFSAIHMASQGYWQKQDDIL